MATSDPMMEAHSLSQEALAVVNIMWWIANISSTFRVISGSSPTIAVERWHTAIGETLRRACRAELWIILRKNILRSTLTLYITR
jgi:hypothetical protein